ncbi:MAG: hypothetical protein J6Y16_07625, partial [Treponema sp.]|nr:hypothetical protein [Treponema sp.]
KGKTESQPFYLPIYNVKNSDLDIFPVKKETASGREDVEKALVGQVSIDNKKGRSRSGTGMTESEYYFPFIKGDYIHADRMGGSAYYHIVKTPGKITDEFYFPYVRMSENEGNDRTFGVNADFEANKTAIFLDAEELLEYFETVKIGGVSGNKGKNTNNGNLTQTVMDINGDSIPDIIQKTDSGLKVYPGIKKSEGIGYEGYYLLEGVAINSTSSVSEIKGASISPSGSVTQRISKNGQVIGTNSSPSVSGGSGFTSVDGTSNMNSGLIDMNGDGLADFFTGNSVRLNKGEDFSQSTLMVVPEGPLNTSSVNSASVNVNIGKASFFGESLENNMSFGGGLSYSVSSNTATTMFLDINGDGLPDKLDQNQGCISVMYNTGNSFVKGDDILLPSWSLTGSERIDLVTGKDVKFDMGLFGDMPILGPMTEGTVNILPVCNPFAPTNIDGMEFSSTYTLSLSGNFGLNFTYNLEIPTAMISINMTFSGGNGTTGATSINAVNVTMMDLDGDGLADHVLRIPNNVTYWKRNISGRYGLLNQINLPQGGNIQIEYAEKYGTRDNPNFKYVMSRVTVNDGTNGTGPLPEIKHGAHSVTTLYEYDGGYYDRKRKEFYGYRTVTTTFADGTYQVNEYFNREYYSKGVPEETRVHAPKIDPDKEGAILSKSKTELCVSPLALPKKEESWTYEEKSGESNFIHTLSEYEYDSLGNCTEITQSYDDGTKLKAKIIYQDINENAYIMGLPIDIKVYGTSNQLLRHRAGKYDGKGQLVKLYQYYNSTDYTYNELSYDGYGNIKSVKDARGATISYEYDGAENMFPVEISQYGKYTDTYKGTAGYYIDTQTKASETDCNGNTMTYKYDDWQRVTEIFTSYDDKIPAVSYEYNNPTQTVDGKMDLWYAITNNKVSFDHKDDKVIQTVVQVDGLGRAVRTAKTGCVDGKDGWNASGAVEYDIKGRTVKEGMTEFIPGKDLNNLLNSIPGMTKLSTSYDYDYKDRQILTTVPDGSAQTNSFHIENNKLISESTDPLGNVSVQETDSHGNIVRVARKDSSGKQLTEVTYLYNEMGEMLKAFDSKGHPVSVEYDMLGRRTALESPDSGRQEFFYDECSNLIRENNSVLREKSRHIEYTYDGLNRLEIIDYPDTVDTEYKYGGAGDRNGAAGKIKTIVDASGTLEYEYGKLGEVTKETRVLNTH